VVLASGTLADRGQKSEVRGRRNDKLKMKRSCPPAADTNRNVNKEVAAGFSLRIIKRPKRVRLTRGIIIGIIGDLRMKNEKFEICNIAKRYAEPCQQKPLAM